jgi:uncharacterized protein
VIVKKSIDPERIIDKYYKKNAAARTILLNHSRLVAQRATAIAKDLNRRGTEVDTEFVAEAAMLHDIGMLFTAVPELGCHGELPYLMHGVKGAEIMIEEGYPRHARVCERHIGIGLTAAEIKEQQLPLPQRDMLPETLEEQIICYADLFYSKGIKNRDMEKSPQQVCKKLKDFGREKVETFARWQDRFEPARGA